MNSLQSIAQQACDYGLIGGDVYNCLKAATVADMQKAIADSIKERDDLIRAIIRITEAYDYDRNHHRWEAFQIALSKADELVDSIPHCIQRTQ